MGLEWPSHQLTIQNTLLRAIAMSLRTIPSIILIFIFSSLNSRQLIGTDQFRLKKTSHELFRKLSCMYLSLLLERNLMWSCEKIVYFSLKK